MLTQRDIAHGTDTGCGTPQIEPMSPIKIEVFKEKFPWITEHIKDSITQVHLFGVEEKLLEYRPEVYVGFISAYSRQGPAEKILFLDKKGKLVSMEIKKPPKKTMFFKPVNKTEVVQGTVFRNESIEEALNRLGDAGNDIYFVLSYYVITKVAIIYKVPGSSSLLEWVRARAIEEEKEIRDAIRSERCDLEKALTEIDEE